MAEKPQTTRPIATNRRARFEYHLLEEKECGIALTGTEVKSLRAGKIALDEAFGHFRGEELYLLNAHIAEYAQGNVHNHPPARARKLLLHRRELDVWHGKVKERGMTIVPVSIYFVGSKVKLTMALAKGKKLYDKRETTKAREDKRAIDRAMLRRR